MYQPGQPQPGEPPIRPVVTYPLSVERLLGLTFSLLRFRWIRFAGLSLIIGLPVYLVVALMQVPVGDDLARIQQAQLDLAAGRPIGLDELVPLRALLVGFVAAAVAAIGGYLAQAAVVSYMAATYAGRRIGVGDALRATAARALTLIGGAALVLLAVFAVIFIGALVAALLVASSISGGQLRPGLGVFGGLIVFVAAVALVVLLTVRWSFLVQAVMLEGLSAPAALRRSWRLVGGSSWRVLGYSILFAVMVGGIGLLVDTFTSAFLGTGLRLVDGRLLFEPVTYLVGTMASAFVSLALAPISIIGLTLVYFDLRHRHGEPPLPSLPGEAPMPGEPSLPE